MPHLLFESFWRPQALASYAHTSQATAFRWENNMVLYGQTKVFCRLYYLGRSPSISPAALDGLLDYQHRAPRLY